MKDDLDNGPSRGANDATNERKPAKSFHGWRLLAVIMGVVVLLAIVSFVVDWVVIGPLEGRAF